jgi:hypothetical protein
MANLKFESINSKGGETARKRENAKGRTRQNDSGFPVKPGMTTLRQGRQRGKGEARKSEREDKTERLWIPGQAGNDNLEAGRKTQRQGGKGEARKSEREDKTERLWIPGQAGNDNLEAGRKTQRQSGKGEERPDILCFCA